MAIEKFKAVHTKAELLNRLCNHRKKLGMTNFPVWYRGHSRVEYNLLPGIFRGPRFRWETEHNMYADFLTQGKRFLARDGTSWETLSTMQHWGTPTRALDWTISLNTALFFALFGATHYPVIWLLNPYEINEKATGRRVIFDELDKPPYDYKDALYGSSIPHKNPIALSVAWMNERIERQSGLFTIHGTDHTALNEQPSIKSSLKHVVIAEDLVQELRRDLLDNGITPFSIYPDLGGICSTIRWKHGYV